MQKITLGKMFQNKQFTDHFCCLLMYVKLATVQIWRQSMNEIYLHVPGMLNYNTQLWQYAWI